VSDFKIQERVEEMTSEKSLIFNATEKDTMNLENESDSGDDKFITEIDLKNLLFDKW